jgi:arylsulfatase A-like enzyme
MIRDQRYLVAATTALALFCQATPAEEPDAVSQDRPNVLLLFTDDQRADTIAALGNSVVKTPNLDRLCEQGLVFNRAYMQGAFGGATCVPSRAMLLSGQSLFRVDNRLLRDETWPAAFGRAGYRTLMTGKWHNKTPSIPKCFQAARTIRTVGYTKEAPMRVQVCDLNEDGSLTPLRWTKKHAAAAYADEAVRFLNDASTDKPFFLYVPFDGPHDPHIVPDDFPITYDLEDIPLPPNFMPAHPFDNGEMKIRDERLLPHPRTPEAIRQMLAEYWRFVSYIDAQVGRILDALAASPHADNTIVVFASDSGVARGSHGLIGKQNLYEYDGIRVPLIIAGTGIPRNQSTEALCYLYDVLPTLGAVCDVPAPSASNGRDLSGVLQDPARPGRSDLVFAYRNVQRAIATPDWKLIRYPKVDRTQLFDLRKDPYEIHDLSGDAKQAARVQELMERLKQRLTEAGDKLKDL